MNIYQPYTYLIGWSNHNIWYYGCQYGASSHPSNLWNTYFTSSDHVKNFRKKHGEPDVIIIRKTFDSKKDCILWESKVLKRIRAVEKDYFLNRNDSLAPPVLYGEENGFYGKTHSTETLDILRRPKTEETKERLRKPKNKTPSKSNEHKNNISESHIGVGHSVDVKDRLRILNEKYIYIIKNINTDELYETTNLTLFCQDHPNAQHNNLVKTYSEYKGKKKVSQSGGYRIIDKKEKPKKKEQAILQHISGESLIHVDDLFEFCKMHNLNLSNLRKTSPTYNGPYKAYTSKGYRIVEILE